MTAVTDTDDRRAGEATRTARADATPATPTPGERRLAHPPSDRYRAAEAAAAAEADAAPDPAASVARGVAIAVVAAIVGAVAHRRARRRPDRDDRPRRRRRRRSGSGVASALQLGAGERSAAPAADRASRSCWRSPRSLSASSACGSTAGREGGVLPLVDYLGEVFGPLVPLEFVAAVVARLAGRPMSDDIRFRRPVEADHARLVGQVDEWWGGRTSPHAPAAPVVPAFHRARRGSPRTTTGGWSASSSGSSARIAPTRPTST